jgi:hypothetical protein
MTRYGEEVMAVYQMQNTWCTSMGFQVEMDKCVTYLKDNWVGICLNGAFVFLLGGLPPPKLKVCGMAFHNMQRKENN